MKNFDEHFKTRLWDRVADIENDSAIEIVVMIKPHSEDYTDVGLLASAAFTLLVFTFFMFAPMVFGDYLIYTGTVLAFLLSFLLITYTTPLKRLLVSSRRMRRSVEIMARALFQKGGLHHTEDHIGTLVYCSLFERQVYLLPDRGAADAMPPEEWERLREGLQTMFAAADPAEQLLEQLRECRPVFGRYLPPLEDDINEIPDDLEVVL